MKKLIKSGLFLAIFCFLWSIVFNVLGLAKTPIGQFYKEKKDTVDVMYIGSSNVYTHFNTVLAYNLYGFTTGMLSTDTQNFLFVYYIYVNICFTAISCN